MTLKEKNTSNHYKLPFDIGLGGVPLGNEFMVVSDEEAEETLNAAWEAGVRYYDVAPWYGLGLAERRFGYFLHNKARGRICYFIQSGQALKSFKRNIPRKRPVPFFPFTQFSGI